MMLMFRTALMAAVTTLSTAGYLFAATNWSEFDSDVLILSLIHI